MKDRAERALERPMGKACIPRDLLSAWRNIVPHIWPWADTLLSPVAVRGNQLARVMIEQAGNLEIIPLCLESRIYGN